MVVGFKVFTGLGEGVNSFVGVEGAGVEDDFLFEREMKLFPGSSLGWKAEVFGGGGVGS